MKQRPRLGKGLEALLPDNILTSEKKLLNLPIKDIRPNPFQPRVNFKQEAIESLANSVKQHGLQQPIIVRKKDIGYEIIAGERRYRACLIAGLTSIPVIVKNVSDQDSFQIALIENLEREDLDAIEEAKGYAKLIDDFELTHQQISDIFGRSRSAITNKLRLLNLPAPIQQAIIDEEISEGHARSLLSLDSPEEMEKHLDLIKKKQLNVRDIETTVSRKKKNLDPPNEQVIHMLEKIEQALSPKFPQTIKIKGDESNGTVMLKYKSGKELESIISQLKK